MAEVVDLPQPGPLPAPHFKADTVQGAEGSGRRSAYCTEDITEMALTSF